MNKEKDRNKWNTNTWLLTLKQAMIYVITIWIFALLGNRQMLWKIITILDNENSCGVCFIRTKVVEKWLFFDEKKKRKKERKEIILCRNNRKNMDLKWYHNVNIFNFISEYVEKKNRPPGADDLLLLTEADHQTQEGIQTELNQEVSQTDDKFPVVEDPPDDNDSPIYENAETLNAETTRDSILAAQG